MNKHPLPAFLDGRVKPLFIDGKSVPAIGGGAFDTINPSTGRRLAQVARGESADIDIAVAAARRALEGPWGRFKPFDRQQVMLRLADIVERNYD